QRDERNRALLLDQEHAPAGELFAEHRTCARMLREPDRGALFRSRVRRRPPGARRQRRIPQDPEQLVIRRRIALRQEGGEHRGRWIDPALRRVAQARRGQARHLLQVALLELHAPGAGLVEAELARLSLYRLALVDG